MIRVLIAIVVAFVIIEVGIGIAGMVGMAMRGDVTVGPQPTSCGDVKPPCRLMVIATP